MKVTATKRATFDAAHFLPGHPGKCARFHGHTYTVEVTVRREDGRHDLETGMVADFGDLSELLRGILAGYDHGVLNDSLANPTAEVLAGVLFREVELRLPKGIHVDRLRVWETPDCFVEVDACSS